ncbi:MAG: DUF948 domain-containing protein [Thermodesulfobacteriota bacterium]
MLLTISVTVIAASMVVLIVCFIPLLLQVRRTSHELEKLMETARLQLVPLSHDLTVISLEAKEIFQSLHRQIDKIEDGVTSVRDSVLRLRKFQEELEQIVEEPLLEFTSLLRNVIQGVETFLRILRR